MPHFISPDFEELAEKFKVPPETIRVVQRDPDDPETFSSGEIRVKSGDVHLFEEDLVSGEVEYVTKGFMDKYSNTLQKMQEAGYIEISFV